MQRVGIVMIGQSPRNDIIASMFDQPANVEFVQHGALDKLDRSVIAELAPRSGELPLVSQLHDGTEIVIAKERLKSHIQRAVNLTARDGASLAVILCVGEFTDITSSIPVIYRDRVLTHAVEAVLPAGTIGVMLPHAGQMEMMRRKWSSSKRRFIGATVSPYSGHDEPAAEARRLRDAGATMIVLDCMGYDCAMKQLVAHESGLATILVSRLIGRVIEELIGA